eukprot:CAMPEP_0113881084 /NCGR_PEP_ID=MMETSP0780_2-20120614/8164_1 /TAXON_ID=652834 /ORGANISM="Palpitomonas bilix" /LENGTH=61 /DNA_ID=CAMNT_0000867871 /DNA_START=126 /DNA_END=311 /DNA_ORIENTATION=+ /assembly_acc=CAM_ASM_000599
MGIAVMKEIKEKLTKGKDTVVEFPEALVKQAQEEINAEAKRMGLTGQIKADTKATLGQLNA